jgi:hypothetical protein
MTTCKTFIPIEIEIKKENKTALDNSKSVKQTKQKNKIEVNIKKTTNFDSNATTIKTNTKSYTNFNTKSLVNNNHFEDQKSLSFDKNLQLDQKTRLNVQHLSPIKPSFVK